MMYDSYINACEDILNTGLSQDIESVTSAIQDEYIIRKDDGSLFVTSPAFTLEQKAMFDTIADRYLAPLMAEYSLLVDKFLDGYKKLFPKHLTDDADRTCQAMFKNLYSTIIAYAQRIDAIELPTPGCFCDVLLQFK